MYLKNLFRLQFNDGMDTPKMSIPFKKDLNHKKTMILKKHIKELKEILKKNNKLNGLNIIMLSTLNDAIETYNKANHDVKNNGYEVESYHQKYISPSYKVRTQSIKDIIKIIVYFKTILKDDLEDDEMDDFINNLIK